MELVKDQFKKEWSGRWDSNPRLDLGKVPYYPYTTAAQINETLTRQRFGDKILAALRPRRGLANTPSALNLSDQAILGGL
jgi:hypothetical protein